MGFIGGSLALVLLASFLMGSQAGRYEMQHYSPAERASGLGLGVFTAMGCAALLGWLVLANEVKRSQRRTIITGIVIGMMFMAVLLTASRGPMASVVLAICAAMLIVGGRRAIGMVSAVLALGGILYVGWDVLPEHVKQRLFGTFFTAGGGVSERWRLLKASFLMLGVAPFFGRTREVLSVTGFAYSHQVISQFMVELGLVGLAVFLVCFVPSVSRWFKAVLHKRQPIWPFAAPLMIWFAFVFIQRNVAGDLRSADFWVLMGIMMGHRLTPTAMGLSPEAMALLEAQAIYDQEGGYTVPAAGLPA
jgi:O-antigen ligase